MSLRRLAAVSGAGVLVLVAAAPPALARKALDFNKPVALFSASPTRTAMSGVYNNGRQGKHEWSGEPVIQVDKKGIIYIAGTCCVVAASPVWRSEDGKKFTEMESPGHAREWGIGAEGDLAVDDEGNVFFVDTYIPGLLITRWSDHGRQWEYTQPATAIPGFDDRPWLAYSDKAIYLYVNHVSHTQVYYSTDGGRTFLSHGPLSWDGSITGQPYFPGHLAADRKKGTLWVGGVNVDAEGDAVLSSTVSKDGGESFREAIARRPRPDHRFSPIFTGTMTVDEAGTGYIAWSEYDQSGCDVFYAASTDLGKSWGDAVRVSDGPGCATFPWITAAGAGKVGLAWYQTPYTRDTPPGSEFLGLLTGRYAYGMNLALAPQDEVPQDANWYLHSAAVTDADSAKPHVVEARVKTKKPVAQGPLQRQLWDFLQLDIGPDGRLHITYADKYKDIAPQTWYVSSKRGPKLN